MLSYTQIDQMQLLPSIFRTFKPKTITFSLLSKNPNPISCNYHNFSLSLLKTHKYSHHFTQILSHAITSGHFTDPSVSSKLLLHSLFCSDNALVFSRSLFFQIENPNIFSWNFMFRAYSQSSSPQESIFLYNVMRCNGLLPDNYTFPSVFKACGRLVGVEKGQEVHCLSMKLGLEFDVFVQNALISMYFQCGVVEFAQRVFDMVPGVVRDVVTWNSMISGYEQSDCCSNALKVFGVMMSDNGVRPNGVSLVSALTACGRIGLLDLGRKIHWFSVVNGLIIDVYLGSSLIDMYVKCGKLEDARMVFDKIPERNSFSWTSMIAGYVQSDLFKEAIQLFREMQVSGVKADSPTIACVISACGHSGALYQGRWVHSYCEKNQIEMNQTVNTSLIDMYSKCGDIEKALEIFHGLNQRDVFSWTAMISGLAVNGQSEKALRLFSEMETSSVVLPNEVTLLGVLSACSHGGLVEEGFYYFEVMARRYNLTPRLEHYGCMVDLLGRANLLVEAEKFIRSLPIQPDVVIWRSLLFACRSHGNIELAEFAAKRIEEFGPEKCGARVLLSNVYASASRWRDVKKVRKSMSIQRIQKQPGCSFVEINGLVHEFLVADCSHDQIEIIYETLLGMNKVLRSQGFDPDTFSNMISSDLLT